jgi:hypothetical protein
VRTNTSCKFFDLRRTLSYTLRRPVKFKSFSSLGRLIRLFVQPLHTWESICRPGTSAATRPPIRSSSNSRPLTPPYCVFLFSTCYWWMCPVRHLPSFRATSCVHSTHFSRRQFQRPKHLGGCYCIGDVTPGTKVEIYRTSDRIFNLHAKVEDGGSRFICNVGQFVPNCVLSQPINSNLH